MQLPIHVEGELMLLPFFIQAQIPPPRQVFCECAQ
jgi:hypothetical protein